MKHEVTEITKCKDCKYEAVTYGSKKCFKCGGKLEIIAYYGKGVVNTNKNDKTKAL